MSITGNIKFFELSKALLSNGATCSASTGTDTQDNVLDFNKLTYWQSVGSDDSTTETLTITFDTPTSITRLLLFNHNFQDFTITPIQVDEILDESADEIEDDFGDFIQDDGTTQEFYNVISSTNRAASVGISETDFSRAYQYYEFTDCYCSGITITITKAQKYQGVGDQDKYCYMVIPTIEVNSNQGAFQDFPILEETTDFNAIISKDLEGYNHAARKSDVFSAALRVPLGVSQNDVALFEFIRKLETTFLIFPCGGEVYSDYFRFEAVPYNFDVYEVVVLSSTLPEYLNNITRAPVTMSLAIGETI